MHDSFNLLYPTDGTVLCLAYYTLFCPYLILLSCKCEMFLANNITRLCKDHDEEINLSGCFIHEIGYGCLVTTWRDTKLKNKMCVWGL